MSRLSSRRRYEVQVCPSKPKGHANVCINNTFYVMIIDGEGVGIDDCWQGHSSFEVQDTFCDVERHLKGTVWANFFLFPWIVAAVGKLHRVWNQELAQAKDKTKKILPAPSISSALVHVPAPEAQNIGSVP